MEKEKKESIVVMYILYLKKLWEWLMSSFNDYDDDDEKMSIIFLKKFSGRLSFFFSFGQQSY